MDAHPSTYVSLAAVQPGQYFEWNGRIYLRLLPIYRKFIDPGDRRRRPRSRFNASDLDQRTMFKLPHDALVKVVQ